MQDSIDEEDFNYRDDNQLSDDGDDIYTGTAKSTLVQNQPHDEEVSLSETESFGGRDDPPNVTDASLIESHDMDELPVGGTPLYETASRRASSPQPQKEEAKPGKLSGVQQASPVQSDPDGLAGAYNAMDYKHLNVSEDVKTLFQYIGRYKPQSIELETKLKPFIPDYIPSVGGLDEFIKVPRPDGKADMLGLKVLDEPAAQQSDPTVLTLQLRQLSKEAPGSKAEMIGRIEHSDESKGKKIGAWINSIADIHKGQPPAVVSYTKRMPDLETLMQEWPPEVEAALRGMQMPTGDLDLDLKTYTKLVCSMLDIPVYENPIESLHLLFSLYLEFKSNPVFGQQLAGAGDTLGPGGASGVYPGLGAGVMLGSPAGTPTTWGRGNSAGSAGTGGLMGFSSPGAAAGANVMTFG